MGFLCRMQDGEDLTSDVQAEVAAASIVVAAKAQPPIWRVAVKCRQGHENIFEGRGQPAPSAGFDVVGQAPAAIDEILIKAVDHMSPVQSLSRLDATAKFFIGLVSTIGALGTGLGLLPGATTPSAAFVLSATLPAIMAAISIVLALDAIGPAVVNVHVGDLNALQQAFDALIQKRGRSVRASGIMLAIAILMLPLVRACQ
jgi:hypothetical protein